MRTGEENGERAEIRIEASGEERVSVQPMQGCTNSSNTLSSAKVPWGFSKGVREHALAINTINIYEDWAGEEKGERAKSGARTKKSERGEAEKEMSFSASPLPPPLSAFFCPRPTFRALSHLSTIS